MNEITILLIMVPVFILIGIVLIFLVSISWTNMIGAPWVPTSMKMIHTMLRLAEVGPNDIVYDLGCGDGRTIVTAARKYGARAVGVEIDPFRFAWCQLLITLLGLRDRVEIRFGNLFGMDLSEATVITCYLLQSTNNRLDEKLHEELRSGTRVVSNTFTFPHRKPIRTDGKAKLYIFNPD